VIEGKSSVALAWGAFEDGQLSDGWGKLSLYTKSFATNREAYSAGLLEGTLTSKYIKNVISSFI
jgi:hypothetical protein